MLFVMYFNYKMLHESKRIESPVIGDNVYIGVEAKLLEMLRLVTMYGSVLIVW